MKFERTELSVWVLIWLPILPMLNFVNLLKIPVNINYCVVGTVCDYWVRKQILGILILWKHNVFPVATAFGFPIDTQSRRR